jgi:hypothetical protein
VNHDHAISRLLEGRRQLSVVEAKVAYHTRDLCALNFTKGVTILFGLRRLIGSNVHHSYHDVLQRESWRKSDYLTNFGTKF